MTFLFWLGTVLGFLAGVAHAAYILTTQSSLPEASAGARAVYRAIWAVVLWTLFGGYLLFCWILGLLLKPLVRRASAGNKAA